MTLLYVGLVLRADNNGEGGILSLITLVARPPRRRPPRPASDVGQADRGASGGSSVGPGTAAVTRTVTLLTVLGIFGASLFLADSMITPATSVLSAVEGLRVVEPELEPLVIPITVVIIVLLFAAQRVGTATVGRLFGPVMTVWFVTIGAAGLFGIVQEPGILRALSPTYAAAFLVDDLGYRDDGIAHVTARFGYVQRTDVPSVLAALPPEALETRIDLDGASYFLSSIELRASSGHADRSLFADMPRWRKLLFVATSRLTADAAGAFELPRDRTVIIGSRIVV